MTVKRFIFVLLAAIVFLGLMVYLRFMDDVPQTPTSAGETVLKPPVRNPAAPREKDMATVQLNHIRRHRPAINKGDEATARENMPKVTILASSSEQFDKLLEKLANHNISTADVIPALYAVRISRNDRLLRQLQDEMPDLDVSDDGIVQYPEEPEAIQYSYARPFNGNLLPWLGIAADADNRGKGVTIAVLDEPVNRTTSTQTASLQELDIFGLATPAVADFHGNSVVSLLVSNSADVKGISPAASILSIPVLDSTGTGSAFQLAAGIVTAVDNGADIISLSLGSESPSDVLKHAVDYASEHGTVIVAAGGNGGTSKLAYPAAYESVIGVSACDAAGNIAYFSNYGTGTNIAAPGVMIAVDDGLPDADGQLAYFSGTSAAAPCVAGVIAQIMSENPGMTAKDASGIVLSKTLDNGKPGDDEQYGTGYLNYTRASHWNDASYTDVSVAGQYLDVSSTAVDGMRPLLITAQNTGNTEVPTLLLNYAVNGQAASAEFQNVQPGASVVVEVNVPESENDSITVTSRAETPGIKEDSYTNNARGTIIRKETVSR